MMEVERVIDYLESMHPAHLTNQILSVNFTTAYFILSTTAGPAKKMTSVRIALEELQEKTQNACFLLKKEFKRELMGDSVGFGSSACFLACEFVCDSIANVEFLLAKATSLLHKFPGKLDMIEDLLSHGWTSTDCHPQSLACRQVIFEKVLSRQHAPGDSGPARSAVPIPITKDYVIQNIDSDAPCQLLAHIVHHNLEDCFEEGGGGPLSLNRSILLAIKKCSKL